VTSISAVQIEGMSAPTCPPDKGGTPLGLHTGGNFRTTLYIYLTPTKEKHKISKQTVPA